MGESSYFVGGVVYDKIHHKLHISLFQLRDEIVDIGYGAVARVDVFVVGDVVAHVLLWTFVNCEEDSIDFT